VVHRTAPGAAAGGQTRAVRAGATPRSEGRCGGVPTSDAAAQKCTEVRLGLEEDAPRIAKLLELNGMPRWVAFEERFIIAEEDGDLLAVLRFREDSERLYLGLLVTDPWAEEHSLAVALYAGARVIARRLGLREIRARIFQSDTYPHDAGYRRWRGAGAWTWPTWPAEASPTPAGLRADAGSFTLPTCPSSPLKTPGPPLPSRAGWPLNVRQRSMIIMRVSTEIVAGGRSRDDNVGW
jgi:hypothetical protein